jgi:NAD(P)-dependent dehydrogenase (short-subunit alcohol dehydrogenase family)
VTDDASVAAAYTQIEADGRLDVLVNNAGIEPRLAGNAIPTPADETAGSVRETFETNAFGLVRVTHAFLPLLQKSAAPVIVNVSSGLGSLADLSNPESYTHFYPALGYPASKTTVNAITIQYAKAFPGIRINTVDPGYTNTNSKLAMLYYAHELQRRVPEGISVAVFEPGFMPGTGLSRQAGRGMQRMGRALQRLPIPGIASSVKSGPALASVTLDERWAHLCNGDFVIVDREREVMPIANDPARERGLWGATRELLRQAQ